MITTRGVNALGNVIANNLATHICIGIGDSAVTASDTDLNFELHREEITVRAFDPSTRTMHFKATMPMALEAQIREVGLLTAASSEAQARIIFTADLIDEAWTGGTWDTTNVRVGEEALRLAAASATLNNVEVNLSDLEATDAIQTAYFGEGGTATVTLYTDTANYLQASFAVQTGFNVQNLIIGEMTVTGTPDRANIRQVTVTHAGTGAVSFDVMRGVSLRDDATLIKRSVLNTPLVKRSGSLLDVEVPLTL